MSQTINSLLIGKPTLVGANTLGYARNKLVIPNVSTQGGDSVTAVNVIDAGSGFITLPDIVFSGGGGSGAVAEAVLEALNVSTVVGQSGSGSYAPGDTLTGTGGLGTEFVVLIGSTLVQSATIAAGGSGGTNGIATVTGTTGSGTPFQASVGISGGAITSIISITVPGNYTHNPLVLTAEPVTGAGLSGAQLSLKMAPLSMSVLAPGALNAIVINPVPTITSGSGTGCTLNVSYGIASIYVTNGGYDFTTTPTVTISGGGGSGATATATIGGSGSSVASVNVTAPGLGFTTLPSASFSGGGGSGAAANAIMKALTASLVTAQSGGGSYAPGDTLRGAGGTGTEFVVPITNTKVTSAAIVAGGSGGTNGTQTITGTTGIGTPFQASVTVTGGALASINSITIAGNYTTNPTNLGAEVITGGGLIGAIVSLKMGVLTTGAVTAGGSLSALASNPVATTSSGSGTGCTLNMTYGVDSLNLTSGGSNYSTPPTVTISGGSGSGATATAVLGTSDPVTVTLDFVPALPVSNYSVTAMPSQACAISYGNKTVNSCDVTLSPLTGDPISAGTMDVIVDFVN